MNKCKIYGEKGCANIINSGGKNRTSESGGQKGKPSNNSKGGTKHRTNKIIHTQTLPKKLRGLDTTKYRKLTTYFNPAGTPLASDPPVQDKIKHIQGGEGVGEGKIIPNYTDQVEQGEETPGPEPQGFSNSL